MILTNHRRRLLIVGLLVVVFVLITGTIIAFHRCFVSRGNFPTQVSAPNSDKGLVLQPGKGIEGLEFGAPPQKIREVLGEPSEIQGGQWTYADKGLALSISPTRGLIRIMAVGDLAILPGSALIPFQGKTAEGIAMGATEEQLVAVYGKPHSREERPGAVDLEYPSIGLSFTLFQGRLRSIHLSIPSQNAVKK